MITMGNHGPLRLGCFLTRSPSVLPTFRRLGEEHSGSTVPAHP